MNNVYRATDINIVIQDVSGSETDKLYVQEVLSIFEHSHLLHELDKTFGAALLINSLNIVFENPKVWFIFKNIYSFFHF